MYELPQLIPGAKPQFYRGNGIACLVVHGFMAAPPEVGWMGQHLAQQGYTVYVPRLTGHGIDPRHMRRMRWEDWYAQVLDAYHLLRQQSEQLFVIGHSMGGLLALLLSTQEPLDALTVAASPVITPNGIMKYAHIIDRVQPYRRFPSERTLNAVIEAEQARRGEEVYSRVHYDIWSSRAVYELYRLIDRTRAALPQVTAPLLLVYSQNDITVPYQNSEVVATEVSSDDVQRVKIERGGHIIFQDEGREQAFAAVADYIAGRVRGGGISPSNHGSTPP